jgi:hypothetical protein
VQLTIEITVDSGTLFYTFYAYSGIDMDVLEPSQTSPSDLQPGFAGPGETVVGTLTFELDRQPMTLVMAGRGKTQLAALPVEG